MASLRMPWVNNGGYATSGSVNSEELQHRCACWRPLLSGHQKNAQSHRISVAARCSNGGTTGASGLFGFDSLIRSDRAGFDLTRIDAIRTKETIGVKEEDKSNKLDQWIRESVVKIVNNIEEAPFLVHVYSDDKRNESSSNGAVRLVVEKAKADDWPAIRGRWNSGDPSPSGVILVEELESRESDTSTEEEDKTSRSNRQLNSATKLWGVLIQAKGLNRTACYILKTCRVKGLSGFCTHFCLLRVECFVESAESQLKNSWLQR